MTRKRQSQTHECHLIDRSLVSLDRHVAICCHVEVIRKGYDVKPPTSVGSHLTADKITHQIEMRLLAIAALSCVCSFDFDLTLRIVKGKDYDFPAPDAMSVIQACQSRGCNIAIASANGNSDKLKHVLGSRVDPSVFTDNFFSSPAFQYGNDDKSISLRAIRAFYNADPGCLVLFDDQWFNKQFADRTGSVFIKVDPSIGVSLPNWRQAVKQLENNKCLK